MSTAVSRRRIVTMEWSRLHGLAWSLRKTLWASGELTDRQNWAFDVACGELGRRRCLKPVWARCSCDLCLSIWLADHADLRDTIGLDDDSGL